MIKIKKLAHCDNFRTHFLLINRILISLCIVSTEIRWNRMWQLEVGCCHKIWLKREICAPLKFILADGYFILCNQYHAELEVFNSLLRLCDWTMMMILVCGGCKNGWFIGRKNWIHLERKEFIFSYQFPVFTFIEVSVISPIDFNKQKHVKIIILS